MTQWPTTRVGPDLSRWVLGWIAQLGAIALEVAAGFKQRLGSVALGWFEASSQQRAHHGLDWNTTAPSQIPKQRCPRNSRNCLLSCSLDQLPETIVSTRFYQSMSGLRAMRYKQGAAAHL